MAQSKKYSNQRKQQEKYILSTSFILVQEEAKYIDNEKA